MTDAGDTGLADAEAPEVGRSRLTIVLLCVIALFVVVAAGAGGWIVGHGEGAHTVANDSVDAGFARDMATHHQQAVVLANYERDYSTDPDLKLLAYDIEEEQTFEIGQMTGWLDSWGLTRSTSLPQMHWMAGHDHLSSAGLMPGMATGDEMNQFETLRGKALDIRFLQLMIYHHQGGIPMAQYAADHASKLYVRQLATAIVATQNDEIIQMDQELARLGASALPPPAE